jgi:hypothetical protein
VTIYNHRATNSLLKKNIVKPLIDYVPFDMPSSRPGKNWKAGSLFAKPVRKPDQN